MNLPQQLDLDGGLHDQAPAHERRRLFDPAPEQLKGQQQIADRDLTDQEGNHEPHHP